MAIVGAAVHLVTTLMIEAAIRQVTVFVTAILPVVNTSLVLMDVIVPPVKRCHVEKNCKECCVFDGGGF